MVASQVGYRKDIIKGFSWLGSFRLITRALSFLRTALIARLLTPSQVGIFGIATIVLAFVEILTETGINIFLTQKKDDIDKYISSAWMISIFRGLIISIVIFLASGTITYFYDLKGYEALFQFIAFVPLIRGFINPSVVKFTKELSFHKEFYYRTTLFLFESAMTILFVYLFPSPMSLAWGLIVGALFEVFYSFGFARPLPHVSLNGEYVREVLGKGKWLTATGIFNYLYHNGDDLIVGKILGTTSLGLYEMAYKISMLPISEGSDVIGRVMFPVYVKMNHDIQRLQRAYLKSVLMITAFAIPLGIIFMLFPKEIIHIILGDQWVGAAEVLRYLALFGVLRAISISVIAPLYALHRQSDVAGITLVSLVVMLISIFPLIARFGLVGAAMAALLGTIAAFPVSIYYIQRAFKAGSVSQ